MNKVTIGMTVLMIFIVCVIGSYISWTMKDEVENHPEITEIGAPPRLDIMVVTVLVLGVAIWIILKFVKVEEDEEEDKVKSKGE